MRCHRRRRHRRIAPWDGQNGEFMVGDVSRRYEGTYGITAGITTSRCRAFSVVITWASVFVTGI